MAVTRSSSRARAPANRENTQNAALENDRAEFAQRNRSRRAATLAHRRAARLHLNDESDTETETQAPLPSSGNNSQVDVVQQHFNRMRNRPRRLPEIPSFSDDDEVADSGDEELLLGVQPFNSPTFEFPLTPYRLKFPSLDHERNYECPHCGSILWREERSARSPNCCNNGRQTINRLIPMPPHLSQIFRTPHFRGAQRRYNGLFSFTALGAGGIQKRTWTQPNPPSMLTLHGKAYHRIFDLQEQYAQYSVSNSSRFYIYDSEFAAHASTLKLNSETASILRTHINTNVKWAREYRSAVDEILNLPAHNINGSNVPYIEFAEVSRATEGPVVGDAVAAPEIAALVYTSGHGNDGPRAVVTYPRNSPDSKPRFLPIWSSVYETLQFPLLHLYGEPGWSKGHKDEDPPYKSQTMNRDNTEHVKFPYYCRQRLLSEPIFKLNSRLAQEWACDSLSRMEESRLTYVQRDDVQRRLASDRSIRDSSSSEQPGKLLPASHPGSPCKRKSDTEDALAIVNRRGRPHLFITVTFNASWPEVTGNLLPGQSAYDRPDLCCRIFKLKLKEIMAVLKSGKIFGAYDSHLSVIEFQKRGYPHAHILITFQNAGPDALNQMDEWVWAQLPSADIANGLLRERVIKYMIHNPCGEHNVNAPCMQTRKDTGRKCCSKYYPQPFRSVATINDKSGRAEYKRADNGDRPAIRVRRDGKWTTVTIGNEWVVPYSPILLMLFDCHICVDVVTATSCVKYLFKYVHKGEDYAKARIQGIKCEIELYRKTRYISAAEATWRLLGFHMVDRYPAVTKIHAHLEGEQYVTYPAGATKEERIQIAEASPSSLMTYFKRPSDDVFAPLTVLDYFEQFTVTKQKKDQPALTVPPFGKYLDGYLNIISNRKRKDDHVCRITFQNPAVGDLFYLRLLLHSIPGRSFLDLRTTHPDNSAPIEHATFHDAARARGLITGDEEYTICMEEASQFEVGHQLRSLFVTLILDGAPASKLWGEFQGSLCEDLTFRLTREEALDEALRQIDLKLQLHGKTNVQVNLPAAIHTETELQRMRAAFNSDNCLQYADTHEPRLTEEQRQVYTTVLQSVRTNKGQAYMIDAPAGTGKTFTEKCLASRLRGEDKVVLIVASTGIAALQLPGGWTAHSMFKLPMDDNLTPSCVCNISSQTQRAELIRQSNLIIWDELPMTHRYCVEALDRTLKDLMAVDQPFGGKTILFSGDWRQTGPIVKNAAPTDTVDAAFISSPLWKGVMRFRLNKSQRDKEDTQYASFVRSIGEGSRPTATMSDGSKLTPLNNHDNEDTANHFQLKYTTDFDELLRFVYPDLSQQSREWNTRAILATTNHSIDRSNDTISDNRPGNYVSFFSSDSLISDEKNRRTAFASPEHLNQLNVQGIPPHELKLKTDTLALITRNLNFSEGLVNGQKCVVLAVSASSRVLQVQLLTEERPRPIVLIPRINFQGKVGRNGICFTRKQFPLRTAYSMTINKSQGQTLSKIGLDLRSSPFAHGQLYVALSRAQNRNSIMCLLPDTHIIDGIPYTDNIVYPHFIQAATFGDYHPGNSISGSDNDDANADSLGSWTVIDEIGDGACMLRCVSRYIYGSPMTHRYVRTQILHHISSNLHVQYPMFGGLTFFNIIDNGVNSELIQIAGRAEQLYSSVPEYLQLMSHPTAYCTDLELRAASQLYNREFRITLIGNPYPAPPSPTTCDLLYNGHNHYQTLTYNCPS